MLNILINHNDLVAKKTEWGFFPQDKQRVQSIIMRVRKWNVLNVCVHKLNDMNVLVPIPWKSKDNKI